MDPVYTGTIDVSAAGLADTGDRRAAPSYWSDKLSWGGLLPPVATKARVQVTPSAALALPAVYAAINIIATDVSCLPLRVYRRRSDGGQDLVTDHPVAELFAVSPDGETPGMRWRQAMIGHVLGWGNAYAEIVFRGDGSPAGLYLLDPSITAAERRPQDKKLFYRTGSATLPPRKVLHVAGLGFDGLSGYSPISLAREAIGLGLAAEAFGASFFGNSARPSGFLKTAQKLNPQALGNLRESWERLHQGTDNTGRVAILEQGLEWQATMINPEDAQFLATREFQVLEICRLFNLPAHKLNVESNAPRANVEENNLDYLGTTIVPWCVTIEQAIAMRLFTEDERRRGLVVRHDTTALMRGNATARTDYYQRLRNMGAISTDEIRTREGLNPIGENEGGQLYLVQGQYVPLSRVAQEPEPDDATPDPDASAEAGELIEAEVEEPSEPDDAEPDDT